MPLVSDLELDSLRQSVIDSFDLKARVVRITRVADTGLSYNPVETDLGVYDCAAESRQLLSNPERGTTAEGDTQTERMDVAFAWDVEIPSMGYLVINGTRWRIQTVSTNASYPVQTMVRVMKMGENNA